MTDLRQRLSRWLNALPIARQQTPMLLGVSGGSDSLSLLLLLHELSADFGLSLNAVTVDHGLRPEARAEADYVAGLCEERAIPHSILTLDWGGQAPNQARARLLRYRALAGHAREIGASLILTGHTADDQAETYLIREQSRSGWWGLAGMSVFSVLPVWPEGEGLVLARPLLSERRETLRDGLTARTINWIDDPSNENLAFERVRARKRLATEDGLCERILADQERLQALKSRFSSFLLTWLDEQAVWQPGGSVGLNAQAFDALPLESRFRLLQHVLPAVSGRESLPRLEAVRALAGEADVRVQTLSGCRIERAGQQILITPELSDDGPFALSPTEFIWQGRVKLIAQTAVSKPPLISAWDEGPVPSDLKRADLLPFHIRKTLPVIADDLAEPPGLIPHLQADIAFSAVDLSRQRLQNWLDAKTWFFGEEFAA